MKPVTENHYVRGARVTIDKPCESPWWKDIEKLREEIQVLMAQHQNMRRRRITTRHVRSNCPRVNQEDHCRTSVTESKKVCSNRKSSEDKNGYVRLNRPCSESSKNLSNHLRVEKKFGVMDPIVCQVTKPSTSALDLWSDESIRKDQLADPEIKPIIEFKELSDEKPSGQNIAPFHPTTKRY
ncbi:integrase_H2C2 domain-containing protein [Trichonephila clavipes]|nr:integrase_H2C2 domain-containing protein [Trichonephila clavipes]